MNLDKSLDTNERFVQNFRYYNACVNGKTNSELIIISVSILDNILDEILKEKLIKNNISSIQIPKVSYMTKIDLCYKMKFIESSLHRTLQLYGKLVENFTAKDSLNSFNELSVQTNILELCRINDNEMFNLILKFISEDDRVNKEYKQIDELIVDIGWAGVVKFICSIIQASLIEALVKIK